MFSDLDARALGTFEGTNDEESWKIIHSNDEAMGIYYKAPLANDGTPRLFITLTHPSIHPCMHACMNWYHVIASYLYIIKHHKAFHCNNDTFKLLYIWSYIKDSYLLFIHILMTTFIFIYYYFVFIDSYFRILYFIY